MKTLRNFLVTSVLSLRIVSSVTVDPTSSMHLVKKSEIKPENAKDGIQKMIQSGFIKSVSRRTKAEAARALRSSQNHPQPPRHEPGPHSTGRKNQKPTPQKTKTTRHEHDDEWYDDYFVRSMLCVYSCRVSKAKNADSPFFVTHRHSYYPHLLECLVACTRFIMMTNTLT